MANTTKRHRSFTSKKEKEPLTFDLEGQDFTARPSIPGLSMLEFAEKSKGGETVTAMLELFEIALFEESYERFDKLVHDPEVAIELETLMEILQFFVEEYASRNLKAS